MPVRRILRMGHPNLRRPAQPLTAEQINSEWFDRLLVDMRDTLHDYGGVGLAAPQIDEPWRVAIIEIGSVPGRYGRLDSLPMSTFINPSIDVVSPEPLAGFWEGCLSVPGLRGYVERPQHIRVNYTTLEGESAQLELKGFHATVFQHEFDHLDATLYVDRVKDPSLLVFEDELDRHRDHFETHPLTSG